MLRRGLCLFLLVLTGCGQVSRIKECKRFVALANPALEELRQLDAPNEIVPEADAYDRLAIRFDKLAADIDALKLKDTELQTAVTPIKNTMTSAAEDCRQYARELREHDRMGGDKSKNTSGQLSVRRKLKRTRSRVSSNLRQYKMLVARVDGVCQPQ